MILNQDVILHFLKTAYFGNIDDYYIAASKRAYRDFCRTIRSQRFKNASSESKEELRHRITDFMKTEIELLAKMKDLDFAAFDEWHSGVCQGIIERFTIDTLCYGQAQKWINMTFKYLCVLDDAIYKADYFKFLHIPMDNIIIDIAVDAHFIDRPVKRWSRWNETEYKQYQKAIRNAIHNSKGINYPPLLWEFQSWKANNIE